MTSLSDFKGKVVMLTYWFPACGPCYREFPYLEEAIKKFKGRDDLVYLGINIDTRQDELVLPLIESSGYSFIPLKDKKGWDKGVLDNHHHAPVNFLINKEGKLIFSHFTIDATNEKSLEMMISYLLDKNPPGQHPN